MIRPEYLARKFLATIMSVKEKVRTLSSRSTASRYLMWCQPYTGLNCRTANILHPLANKKRGNVQAQICIFRREPKVVACNCPPFPGPHGCLGAFPVCVPGRSQSRFPIDSVVPTRCPEVGVSGVLLVGMGYAGEDRDTELSCGMHMPSGVVHLPQLIVDLLADLIR